jgi:hypothetical protein
VLWVVAYDPNGGFVTGAGSIESPLGAYARDPSASGKAIFQFVARYVHGAQTPTGATSFRFKAGDLDFASESLEWLVVNQGGTNAQFKGKGTINGKVAPSGEYYDFMVWATDDDPDTFRILITWEREPGVVHITYDNRMHQPIASGNIRVHE